MVKSHPTTRLQISYHTRVNAQKLEVQHADKNKIHPEHATTNRDYRKSSIVRYDRHFPYDSLRQVCSFARDLTCGARRIMCACKKRKPSAIGYENHEPRHQQRG